MRVRRTEILPIAETAIRNAVRNAVRDALREVSLEAEVQESIASFCQPKKAGGVSAGFISESDEEAWERFDSIRFARVAGMPQQHAS